MAGHRHMPTRVHATRRRMCVTRVHVRVRMCACVRVRVSMCSSVRTCARESDYWVKASLMDLR